MDWVSGTISIILAFSVPLVIGLGLWYRLKGSKGIGWQYIRFTVIAISIPVAGLLALNGKLTGEASTIIAAALGYAFGKDNEATGQKKSAQPKPETAAD
ncbi:hypothetical protein EN868_11225 [Mesorhizobium sp. M2D.F.Ca.ET.225.01.1.1]|uniref:hypothetical protein n=1 Tax=unclassified Mesorhizobium TaxID=325217 RepID=UPI000FD46A7D|nr:MULTISPECIES: hypothetical protein [unclassified Mesorhizobium]TGP59556.1 hypothetical protein EN869_014895 [Mesorhizobium sp. M2D.F.Ca.ET.226.01.1.1]TGP69191.1 hypothetical protein EN868_11225 [Mesorhizobium sp. M2D.F.Ca.ET.225.01.1.1]